MKWLIYGHRGWIGSYFCELLKDKHPEITLVYAECRADDIQGVISELDTHLPDRVLCFIGRTSGPGFNSIDYLEQPGKLVENVRDNLFSPLVLMKLCSDRNIHMTYLGTGCVFSYDNPNDEPFTEESKPNFFGSSYSTIKSYTDTISKLFDNVLNVRIRMPIVDYDCPKNFISKIIRYPNICNTLNSMTVLPDLLPKMVESVLDGRTGTVNLVNPGAIDHVTILEMYKKYMNPDHKYALITEEDQNKMLLSKRSKNVLVSSFSVPNIHESIENIFKSGSFELDSSNK